MPRAVPPHADNPSTYITGLLHIGAVYIAFESLWQNILGFHSDIAPIPYTYPFSSDPTQHDETPQITERTRHILEAAYWSDMLRAARIKSDIRTMTGWPDHVIDEQIRSVATSGCLGKFTLHIRDAVTAKPHLLLAYAYSLYLALLSGGSYIRTELMYLKSDFWHETPTPIRPNMVECKPNPGFRKSDRHSTSEYDSSSHGLARDDPKMKIPLEFLDFDPPLGDNPRQQTKNLKAEFKRRFAEAEQLLAEPERSDVIKESAAIFHNLEGVVGQLDKLFVASQVKGHAQRVLHPPTAHSSGPANLSSRLRDSIAIAKGRLLRARRKSSGSSVAATTTTAMGDLIDFHTSSNSGSSSVSQPPGDYKGAQPGFAPQEQSLYSDLARDAVVPAEGFRTIRYGSDLPRPDRSSPRSDDEKGRNPHGFDGASFDHASSDVEFCPMTRVPTMQTAVCQQGPNYALYAIISNFVMLLGIAIVFAAYLYVRHGESRAMSLDL